MSDWRTATVAELESERALLVQDGNHGNDRPRPDEFVIEGVPFIRAADMDGGRVLFEQASRVNEVARNRIRKGHGRAGDTLLSHKGTVGKIAYVPEGSEEFVCSPQTTFWRATDSDVIEPRYIPYLLRSPKLTAQLDSAKSATDMAPYVSLTQQRQLVVDLPPLPEQRAIAEVLGAFDDKIASNTTLAASAWSLMGTEFRAIQTDRHLERSWLGTIAAFEYGKALPTGAREPGEVSVVGSAGVSGVHSQALVEHSGVVVGRKGSAGAVHWVSGPHFPIDTTFYVRSLDDSISQSYLYFLLRTLRLNEMNNDSAVPGLNRAEALALPVSLPPVPARTEFARHAEALIACTDVADRENRTLAATRDALLPQLMSGKLRVRDAERIAAEAGA